MSIGLRVFSALWLCACAAPSNATNATSPASKTTPVHRSEQNDSKSFEVALLASKQVITAGESVKLTIVATNRGRAPVWTAPSIICTGSWDIVFRNSSGVRVRVDDRDAMGCPSGGTLTKQIPPGESIELPVTWDGLLRPEVGQTSDAPDGEYDIEATVRWSAQSGARNAPGPDSFVASARTTITVSGAKTERTHRKASDAVLTAVLVLAGS